MQKGSAGDAASGAASAAPPGLGRWPTGSGPDRTSHSATPPPPPRPPAASPYGAPGAAAKARLVSSGAASDGPYARSAAVARRSTCVRSTERALTRSEANVAGEPGSQPSAATAGQPGSPSYSPSVTQPSCAAEMGAAAGREEAEEGEAPEAARWLQGRGRGGGRARVGRAGKAPSSAAGGASAPWAQPPQACGPGRAGGVLGGAEGWAPPRRAGACADAARADAMRCRARPHLPARALLLAVAAAGRFLHLRRRRARRRRRRVQAPQRHHADAPARLRRRQQQALPAAASHASARCPPRPHLQRGEGVREGPGRSPRRGLRAVPHCHLRKRAAAHGVGCAAGPSAAQSPYGGSGGAWRPAAPV
jgi:hypothetical protein